MEFARNILLKYGWEDGKGLGKQESGISKAIKPKLKFNTDGLGFDASEQFTHHWWEQAYNNAASNIDVSNTKGGDVDIKTLNTNSHKISTKKTFISELEREKLEYGSFKKIGVLKDKVLIANSVSSNDDDAKEEPVALKNLTDEELYTACQGRTGHKAARHGNKLNGKLARINNQDQIYTLNNLGNNKVFSVCNKITNNKEEENVNLREGTKKIKTKRKRDTKDQQEKKIFLEPVPFLDQSSNTKSQSGIDFLLFAESGLGFKISTQDKLEKRVNKVKKERKPQKLSDQEEKDNEFNCSEHKNNNTGTVIFDYYIQDKEIKKSEEIVKHKIKNKRRKQKLKNKVDVMCDTNLYVDEAFCNHSCKKKAKRKKNDE